MIEMLDTEAAGSVFVLSFFAENTEHELIVPSSPDGKAE